MREENRESAPCGDEALREEDPPRGGDGKPSYPNSNIDDPDLSRNRQLCMTAEEIAQQEAQERAVVRGLKDTRSYRVNGRTAVLTPLSAIQTKRAKWVWKKRIALGTLALVAGLPSAGKSTLVYWLVAQVTNGELYGEFYGKPKDVIICATEDDYAITIKPRLLAAGANVDKIFRIEITSGEEVVEGLNLVEDLETLRMAAQDLDIGLLVLDPLMSRLGGKLDSHKDAEVRVALEPLTHIARECQFAVIGLMHFNKGGGTNWQSLLMGSVAFGAVARSVHIVTSDPEDPRKRIFGTEKNNLGPVSGPSDYDLNTWIYSLGVTEIKAEDGDPEPVETTYVVWEGNSEKTVEDAIIAGKKKDSSDNAKETKYDQAVTFLSQTFKEHGGKTLKSTILKMAKGHSEPTLRRAMREHPDFHSEQTRDEECGYSVAYWGFTTAFESQDSYHKGEMREDA